MNHQTAIRLGVVSGAHLLVIGALLHTVQTAPPVPPKEITVTLETPAPLPVVAPPQPKPKIQPPPPQPAPRPVVKHQPVPKPIAPIPVAKPNEVATEPQQPKAEPTAAPAPVAPPAPPRPAEPAPVTQPRVEASASGNRQPVYPAISRKLAEEGVVMLEVYVRVDGLVGDIRVKQSSGYSRLDNAALDAVRKWKFTPAKQGGQPIAMWYGLPVRFSLVDAQ
ncbi:energy transducer TonB [Amantichitinum ursilacus]|uniref:Gram-negative bacterial tonB protein n=1 Tax=Amantichitinum ursilacus TaxID=857265 RepID=A0A0N1JRL3_9NEIS|nr:energy transducer TonB [Amantichitinum ursilacus]KPC49391.1 Gram-negative bacterial tonB protein [Amantichitinum ursilacus]